jgi:hypothetical protein
MHPGFYKLRGRSLLKQVPSFFGFKIFVTNTVRVRRNATEKYQVLELDTEMGITATNTVIAEVKPALTGTTGFYEWLQTWSFGDRPPQVIHLPIIPIS